MNFADAIRLSGLMPRDIVPDGRWRRCATEDKPKKKNGAYKLALDGRRGWWRNFAIDGECNSWADDKAQQAAQIDWKALRDSEARSRREAVRQMRLYWHSLSPLRGGHPYIEGKGLSMNGCDGLRIDGELIVIPLYADGRLMSLQTIAPDGQKRYRTGCPVSGATYVLERRRSTLTALAEGFATGLAVYQCVPLARVIVCFDAGNLVKVASQFKARGLTVVCADNDWKSATNTGIDKGRQAAEAIGCGVAYPEGIDGTDWADALLERGPARVRLGVMRGAQMVT